MNEYINPVERMRLIALGGGDGEWVIREGEGEINHTGEEQVWRDAPFY